MGCLHWPARLQVTLRRAELIALAPIMVGVFLATGAEIASNFVGTFFAVCGLMSTGFYQIWVKTEQKALDLNAWQLLYLQAPTSCAMLFMSTPFLEDLPDMLGREYEYPLGSLRRRSVGRAPASVPGKDGLAPIPIRGRRLSFISR